MKINPFKISLFFTLLFLLFSGFGLGQTKEIDSLEGKLKTATTSLEKISLYDKLAKAFIHNDISRAKAYNDSLFDLSQKEGNQKMKMTSIYNNGVFSRLKGEYTEAEKSLNEFLDYTLSIKDSVEIVKANYQLGSVYMYLDKKEAAISKFFEALEYLENSDDVVQKGKVLNGIAIVYSQTSQYEKSKEYNSRAVTIALKEKDSSFLSILYNGLGITLKNQDSTAKALHYFEKSLEIAEKTNNLRTMGYQYRNIGIIHSLNEEYAKAEPFLVKALAIRRQMKNKSTIGGSLSDLANVYLETGRLEKAEVYLKEAIAIFKENKTVSNENTMYYYLGLLEAKRGNSEKALALMDRYYITRDSLQNIDLQEKINDIDVKYQSEKKDKEIAEQQLALADSRLVIQESNSKTRTMSILIVSLLLGSILLWFSFRQRQKRMQQQLVAIEREQEVRTLESLMEGEEKERFRIAKELHDGVNGDLAAIKFKLTSLLETNNQVINEAVAMIDNSSEQVRAISHNLVPPSLRDFNLLEAVATYCENMNAIHDPEISFQHLGEDIVLEKKLEANLFRIVQELVTNSIKHASAKEIHVQLSNVEENLQLTVEDDGKGFDVGNIASDGIGMQNVKSRVEYLGGLMDIKSDTKGTSFTITITDKSERA
ncbi:tetratricopeptide repeat protein [Aggregatimonas sangjinii]|uniref:Oxygen sensor histidine kinase NreB n=1 Tax=Aggregatimonas sangjinii TaxID=2583587 RepID=A0A5B7SW84_9FLAO|nr:tetratricopeptide repeat protein [Aggregatimonas sangjinii]QCX01443.1 tetratricopeptide repeat protein [Aggregatimonas sangjinii]